MTTYVLENARNYGRIVDLAHLMTVSNVKKMPIEDVESWIGIRTVDRFVHEEILVQQGSFVELNIAQFNKQVSTRLRNQLHTEFPADVSRCIGPPWGPDKVFLLKCNPTLPELSSCGRPDWNQAMHKYTVQVSYGIPSKIAIPKPLKNVTVLPVFHERDYLQLPKVRNALEYFQPEAVAFESLAPGGTRYLISTTSSPRACLSLSYCVVMRQYSSPDERINFLIDSEQKAKNTKFCITAESDINVVSSVCLSRSLPYFTMGIPEEYVRDFFPEFHKNEVDAWYGGCKDYEQYAIRMSEDDPHALIDQKKIAQIENILGEGRRRTTSEYQQQLDWTENYMASRICDLCEIVGYDIKIAVFVGACHSEPLRLKLDSGSWTYTAPLSERIRRMPAYSMHVKTAAYALLDDPENANFQARLQRTFAPSPLFSELFNFTEEDIRRFVEDNKKRMVPYNEGDSVMRKELFDFAKNLKKSNPEEYRKLVEDVRRQLDTNNN